MAKKLAKVSASDLVDRNDYGAADGYVQQAIPFWDFEPPADPTTGDPTGWSELEPTFAPGIWEQLTLGNYALPGKWRLSGSVSQDLDVQKPQGFDGAALITRGYVPAIITMEGTIWTGEQWAIFQRILPHIWRRPNKIAGQDVVLGQKGQVYQAQTASYAQNVAALQMAGFTLAQAKAQATATAALQAASASAAGNVAVARQKNLGVGVQQSPGLIVGKEWALAIQHPATQLLKIAAVVISRPYLPEPGSIFGTMVVKFDAREYIPEPDIVPTAQRVTKGTQTKGQRGPGAIQKKIAPSGQAAANAPGKVPTGLP